MLTFTKVSIIAAATLLSCGAQARDDSHSIAVRMGDINLSTAQGQKILALRIDRAARTVCDFASDQLDLKVRRNERMCREQASASAWEAIKTNVHLAGR